MKLALLLSLRTLPSPRLLAVPQACLRQRRFFSSSNHAMADEYKLKSVSSLTLAPGEKQEVEVDGIDGAKVLLVNVKGEIKALGPKCTHYGAPLVNGILSSSGRLTCPWHGACFNAKTGDIEDAPALDALPVFKLSERDGAVYVCGDAETIKNGRRSPNFKCSVDKDLPPEEHIVVVGGGSAALGFLEGLREDGYKGPLTVISDEPYYPIDRTKLSKALPTEKPSIPMRGQAWFNSGGVKWLCTEALSIDFIGKTVNTSKSKYPYKQLVLATGGTPRRLPLQGFEELENIFTIRTFHDVRHIVNAIGDKGKNIVVIGSSFIGIEVAIATSKDNSVTIVGMEKSPLERVLGEKVGDGVRKAMEAKGVKFHMSASVDKAEPSATDPSQVGAVLLKDGTRLVADLIILGVGVAPATGYLRGNKQLELEKDGSIKTDENFVVAGLTDVYAIGDIASFPYHGPGGHGQHVRIEHWNVAQNAGRVAARHIASPPPRPAPEAVGPQDVKFIPTFWSAMHAQLRYCGNGAVGGGWDDMVVDGDVEGAKFTAWYFKGDDVVAVASMGRDPLVMKAAALMREGGIPGRKEIAAAGYEL